MLNSRLNCTRFGSKCARWMVCALNSRSLNGNAYNAAASATVQSFRSGAGMEDDFPSRTISAWLVAGVMISPDGDWRRQTPASAPQSQAPEPMRSDHECWARLCRKTVQPSRIVDQDLAPQFVRRRPFAEHVEQLSVVRHMRVAEQAWMRPVGAPDAAIGISLDKTARRRGDVVIGKTLDRAAIARDFHIGLAGSHQVGGRVKFRAVHAAIAAHAGHVIEHHGHGKFADQRRQFGDLLAMGVELD